MSMTHFTESLNKSKGGLSVIQLGVKRRSVALYVKAMEKRLTTREATVEVHWHMFQLGLQVVQRIGLDNLNVLSFHLFH